jgi:hypothetical protein
MQNNKSWFMLSLVLVIACLISAFFGYQAGYSSGRLTERRSALSLPGTVDVYGCGVDQFVRLDAGRPVPLHELLRRLQPLPPMVNGVSLFTNNSTKHVYFATLAEALATNGMGNWPLRGGEIILFVHGIK